jgi:hypothetical protein
VPTVDGLIPREFFTYQFVYLPDYSHRYGLKVAGGAGELRATLNMVNGWMFTGPGPIYFRDSSTSENVNASGNTVAQVTGTLAKVALSAAGLPTSALSGLTPTAKSLNEPLKDYAVVRVFEVVQDATGKPSFNLVNETQFDRENLGVDATGLAAPGQTQDQQTADLTKLDQLAGKELTNKLKSDEEKIDDQTTVKSVINTAGVGFVLNGSAYDAHVTINPSSPLNDSQVGKLKPLVSAIIATIATEPDYNSISLGSVVITVTNPSAVPALPSPQP